MKLTDLEEYAENFRRRVLQDALNEATAGYWTKRAETFDAVGNASSDEIARACRNRATMALPTKRTSCCSAEPEPSTCPLCGTRPSPWTCSCGHTRTGGDLDDVG